MNSPTPAALTLTGLPQPGSSPSARKEPKYPRRSLTTIRREIGLGNWIRSQRDALRLAALALWAAGAITWASGVVPRRWDAPALCAVIVALALWLADGERQRRAGQRANRSAIEAAMREAALATRCVAYASEIAGFDLPADLQAVCAPQLRVV